MNTTARIITDAACLVAAFIAACFVVLVLGQWRREEDALQ